MHYEAEFAHYSAEFGGPNSPSSARFIAQDEANFEAASAAFATYRDAEEDGLPLTEAEFIRLEEGLPTENARMMLANFVYSFEGALNGLPF